MGRGQTDIKDVFASIMGPKRGSQREDQKPPVETVTILFYGDSDDRLEIEGVDERQAIPGCGEFDGWNAVNREFIVETDEEKLSVFFTWTAEGVWSITTGISQEASHLPNWDYKIYRPADYENYETDKEFCDAIGLFSGHYLRTVPGIYTEVLKLEAPKTARIINTSSE